MERARILLVEDDRGVRESLALVLRHKDYGVLEAVTGEAALHAVGEYRPHLVILDLNLPGMDGLDACRQLRRVDRRTPILMLTARHEVADRVAGLDAGADDYLPKPFALDELFARIRALLWRHVSAVVDRSSAFTVGELAVDPAARTVEVRGERIELTRTEFDLLVVLVANAGTALARDEIRLELWGPDGDQSDNALDVNISSLRKKLAPSGADARIRTIRGVGYLVSAEP